jgi:homoserine O-acetyltransferase/O-succinyltransferase
MSAVHVTPSFVLEDGTTLTSVRQAYTLLGELNGRRDNLVLLFHSLTGTPDPREWWRGVVGPGAAIDTDRYAVLAPNLLGSPYGTTRPPEHAAVTTRDMVRLAAHLVDILGVRRVALAAGGSLGGMATLEWLATFPRRTRSAVVFAAPAAHTAWAIALNHVQREALRLGAAAGDTDAGLRLARMMAMLSYRTSTELDARFGRATTQLGDFQVASYLRHHGQKLAARFDARAYHTLTGAMDSHDVGRGRGGVASALRASGAAITAVGIPGDLLYDDGVVRRWAGEAGARYREIRSLHGHDAFLLEPDQVREILADALACHAAPARRGRSHALEVTT